MGEDGKLEQAVVLSGGGAHGAYEVGVLKALVRGDGPQLAGHPFEPRIYTGTSIGAINSAILTSAGGDGVGEALKFLEHVWMKRLAGTRANCGNGAYRFRGDLQRYLDPACLMKNPLLPMTELLGDGSFLSRELVRRMQHFAGSSGPLPVRLLELPDVSNLIDCSPLNRLIREVVDLETVRQSALKCRIVSTDWRHAQPKVFANADLSDAHGHDVIVSSGSLPGLMPPVEIDGELYVDGCVVLNTPLSPVFKARDPDTRRLVLHVVYLDPHVEDIPFPELPNTISTISRLSSIFLSRSFKSDIGKAARVNRRLRDFRRLRRVIRRSRVGRTATLRKFSEAELAELEKKVENRVAVEIHRYRPATGLASTVLGILDFRRRRLAELVARGDEDARDHDCEASGCEKFPIDW